MIDKRLMYAQGQRVGFRGGGMDMGNASNEAQSASMGNSTSNNTSNDTSNDNSNNNSNDGPRGPQELGTSTRTVDRITAPEAYEIIGGEKFDVTPDTRDERNKARELAQIIQAPLPNITDKGTSFFKDNKLINTFAPKKNQFNMFSLLSNAALFAINPVLAAKYNKAKSIYSGAKFAKDLIQPYTEKNLNKPFEIVEGLTKNIGLKDKNVIESFKNSLTNNLTSKNKTKTKTKPVINTDTDNNRDGIASLENANVLQDEYSILFQKLQTGNISDAERTRYTMLKNMLGI